MNTIESYNEKQISEFRKNMAQWIFDLSICFGIESRVNNDDQFTLGMQDGQIKVIIEMIVRLVKANNMTFDLEPYSKAIKKIASGKVEIYKLNVVNLMRIFTQEVNQYKSSKNSKPEKW